MTGNDVFRYRANGSQLSNFIGKPVTLLGLVMSATSSSTAFEVKTPDNYVVSVTMRQPVSEPLSGYVEFRGTAQGKTSLICDDYTIFPDDVSEGFDAEGYTEAMALLNSIPNEWTQP